MLEIEVVTHRDRKGCFANRNNGGKSATANIVLYLGVIVFYSGFSKSSPKLEIESYPLPLAQGC